MTSKASALNIRRDKYINFPGRINKIIAKMSENEGLCSEPTDIAMTVLDVANKCLCADSEIFRGAAKLLRSMWSTGMNIAICMNLVIRYFPHLDRIEFILPMFAVELICMFIVGCLVALYIRGKIKHRTFLIPYKLFDFIFSGVNAGLMVYAREEIVLNTWEDYTAVILTASDILDPIEIIIACCWKSD